MKHCIAKISLVLFALLMAIPAFAQDVLYQATVTDSQAEPLIGATVRVVDTDIVTITDIDGNFSIKVPKGGKVEVSYIGYLPMTITDFNIKEIVLQEDSQSLDEVVVVGYGTQKKAHLTGAISTVAMDDIKDLADGNLASSLSGLVNGLSVSGGESQPGTNAQMFVRGARTIGEIGVKTQEPLFVIDGVVYNNSVKIGNLDNQNLGAEAFNNLDPNDVESITVLKDASAAVYGSRAANGVILVTTKKGKAGRNSVSYTGEFTMRLKPSYSTFNIMNSQDQMGVYQELAKKGYLNYAEIANASTSGVYGKMYQLISQYDATSGQFGLPNTKEARDQYLRAAEYRNTDWFDELFSNAVMQNHSVSLSSGTDKAQHYVSASVMYDPGWYKQSTVQRYTANLNSNFNISDKVSFNLISNASFRKQKAPGTLGSETDMVTGEVKRDFDINPYSYSMNTSRTLDAAEFYTRNYAPFNIMHELKNNYMKLGVNDFRLTGILTYKPIKKVELSLLGGVQNTATSQEHFIKDDSNQAEAYRAMPTSAIRDKNPLLYKDPDNVYALPISVLPNGGIYERTDRSMFKWDIRAAARYNDVYAENHIVNLYAGMETNSVNRHSTWFRGWGEQYKMGEVANYAYQVFKRGMEENTEYYYLNNTRERSAAFFANATYSYQGRYNLNGTIRYEGTNFLGKSRSARWLPTWNVSASWNAHEESWWSSLNPTWSHLTLKGSYSLTGDRPSVSNAYAIIGSSNPWRPFAGVNESQLYVSALGNGDLTYEKKHELNLGLSTGFIDNRINLEFDWYKRNNYDLIGVATTQGIGGQIQKFGNIASMRSHGVEISLTTRNIVTRDFTWTTNFIYSHSKNKVTDLKTTKRLMDLVSGNGFAQEGYPVRSLFSIPFKGLNDEGLPTFLDQDGNISTTGIYFQTSDPEKLKFLEYSGSIDPTDVGSFGNIFRYKGISLNVYITYSFGNVVRLDPVFKNTYTDLTATPKEFLNRWTVSGDENRTTVPVIASQRQNKNDSNLSYAYNAYNYSTERIAKGDFIRMKEISVSYEFPRKAVQAMRMTNCMVKLQATNLFLIYADKKLNGQDPEFFNTGGVAAPTPKQFTLTVNFGF